MGRGRRLWLTYVGSRTRPNSAGITHLVQERLRAAEDNSWLLTISMQKTALIAVGGNSLIRAGEKGTVAQQLANARRTAVAIVGLIQYGYHLIITHGNGPQVGAQLLRSELASDQVPGQTLDVCGAASQGEIGYLLAQALRDELFAAGLQEKMPVAAVVTQTVISADDPAMQHPSKPIGPFYSRAEAEARRHNLGWHIFEDAARGYRRLVPSPSRSRSSNCQSLGHWWIRVCWSWHAEAVESRWSAPPPACVA